MELMVTLIIMGVVLAASLPAFTSSLEGQRLRSAANQLQSELRLTRSRAIAEDTPYILAYYPVSGQVFAVKDENLDGNPDWGTEPQVGPMELPKGISLSNHPTNTFPSNQIIFETNGSTDNQGAIILTSPEGDKLVVDVEQPSGVIDVLTEEGYQEKHGV